LSTLSTLRAIWQADGAFPSGSVAFSYGIEGVLALRPGMGVDEFEQLVRTILRQRWASYDRVALLRAFRAGDDLDAIAKIDCEVEASTLVETLRAGSRRHGASFLASHARLGDRRAGRLREAVRSGRCLGHIAVMQGAIWSATVPDAGLAQVTSGYAVASGMVTAAVRLGAIGALQGQGLLRDCLPLIAALSAEEPSETTELMSFLPFLDVAAARQAHADVRLFAN
jgi:urease accessory protein